MTDYRLYFGVDQTYAQLCKLPVMPDVMKAFKDAVDEDYEFEMYVDDIRLRGQVGYLIQEGIREGMKLHYYLNTHLHFDIAYNNVEAEEGKNKVSRKDEWLIRVLDKR